MQNLDDLMPSTMCTAVLPSGPIECSHELFANISYRSVLSFLLRLDHARPAPSEEHAESRGWVQLDTPEGGLLFRCWSSNHHVEFELWHAASGSKWVAETSLETARHVIEQVPNLHGIFQLLSSSACSFATITEGSADGRHEDLGSEERFLLLRGGEDITLAKFQAAVRAAGTLKLVSSPSKESDGVSNNHAVVAATGELMLSYDPTGRHVVVHNVDRLIGDPLTTICNALEASLLRLSFSANAASMRSIPVVDHVLLHKLVRPL